MENYFIILFLILIAALVGFFSVIEINHKILKQDLMKYIKKLRKRVSNGMKGINL